MADTEHAMDYPCQVESGLQLLARLNSRPSLFSVHPELFQSGPKFNEVTEVIYDVNTHHWAVLCEFLSNVILPQDLGGKNAGAILVLTDGQFDLIQLVATLNVLIRQRDTSQPTSEEEYEKFLEFKIDEYLENLHILHVYDSQQFNITIQSLENVLSGNKNIALVIVDTISAFYWADRMASSTMFKMDTYVKKILRPLQMATKEYKSVILYTRPSYFVSKGSGAFENLENCVETPSMERINHRISLTVPDILKSGEEKDELRDFVNVGVTNSKSTVFKNFVVADMKINWY